MEWIILIAIIWSVLGLLVPVILCNYRFNWWILLFSGPFVWAMYLISLWADLFDPKMEDREDE